MPASFETFLALRYLRSKRKEVFISIITVISVLGVALSVMVLDMVMAIMTGFESALQAKLLDATAHVTLREYGGDLQSYDELIKKIEKVEGVVSAYPYTYNQAMISSEVGARGILIRGVGTDKVSKEKVAQMLKRPDSIERLFQPAEIEVVRPDDTLDMVKLPPLIVGRELYDRMNLKAGTPVTLFAPQFSASPQGVVPKFRRFIVVDYYTSGLIEYESGLAYAAIADAQQFFGLGDAATGIEIIVDDLMKATEIGQNIKQALENDEHQYYVTDWTEQNKPLWDAIQLEKQVYFIVLLLLILVASFSIVSTLVMVVMEKSKDIAVLKSMGASDSSILKVFLIQGSLIGATGIVLGTILGYLGCIALRTYGFPIDARVFSISEVPVEIVPANMLAVALAAFVITSAAGIYPARRAARLRPADSLRFE